MENMPLEIETLIIAEIAQTITPDEQKRLNQIRDSDPAVRQFSAELYQSLGDVQTETEEQMDISVKKIIALADAPQRRKRNILVKVRYIPLLLATAACVVIAVVIYAVINMNDKKQVPVFAEQQTGEGYLFDGVKRTALQNKKLTLTGDGHVYLDGVLQQISTDNNSVQHFEINTGRKKIFSIELADGSFIIANAGSTVRIPRQFDSKERAVFINGEAYCTIAPKAGHPFIVNYPTGKVEVLGTEFNINTYGSEKPSVAVVTGSVRMNNEGISRQLNKGEKGTFSNGGYAVNTFDVEETTSWQKNKLVFQNATKKNVEDAFETFYGKKLSFDNSVPDGLGRINIVRTDREEDFILQIPYQLDISVSNDVYYVKMK